MIPISAPAVDRGRALAFRLDSQNLAVRLPPGSILAAAGACGVQNTPPGSAALALHARVEGMTPGVLERALLIDKALLQLWSLRAAPHVFPVGDAAVFTAGAMPPDEASLRFFIRGAEDPLRLVGMSATELVDRVAAGVKASMDGRTMTKPPLAVEVANRLAARLGQEKRAAWESPSRIVPDMTTGVALVRFALYLTGLQGVLCFAGREGNQAPMALTEQWLGRPLPAADPGAARAELVRRYLHCYGPSTPGHFAEWAGIAPAQAAASWKLVDPGLAEVTFGKGKAWLLRADMPSLMAPPLAEGVRFLPPHEPLLQMRDRETLIPDKKLHRHIWRPVGNPGVVLAGGQAVAAWRSQKKGKQLNVQAELFEPAPASALRAIEAEAQSLAPFSKCTSVRVEFTKTR